MRTIIAYLILFTSLNVFAQQAVEDFDVFDLDELSEVKLPPVLEQPRSKKLNPVRNECRCRCLTKGKKTKNQISFLGKWSGQVCECSCLVR